MPRCHAQALPIPFKTYRPNNLCISQPSRPAAASGRTEVRVGAGRLATPVVDIGIGADIGGGAEGEGEGVCEEACTMLGNNPADCEFGSGTGAMP